jgi:hypothetical protein
VTAIGARALWSKATVARRQSQFVSKLYDLSVLWQPNLAEKMVSIGSEVVRPWPVIPEQVGDKSRLHMRLPIRLFILLLTMQPALAGYGYGNAAISTEARALPTPASEIYRVPPMSFMLAPTNTLASCPVTIPNRSTPPGERPSSLFHGDETLWTLLWPDGKVVIHPQDVGADGSLETGFAWWRAPEVGGELMIQGRRLDAPAPPLRSETYESHGTYVGQGSKLIFPTEGCWEITGKVGDAGTASLTFVVLVVEARASLPVSGCPVTIPNGSAPPGGQPDPAYHGNGVLWTLLPSDGVLWAGSEFVRPDGTIDQKFMWWRAVHGGLVIEGQRLDAVAPTARGSGATGYGLSGFTPGFIRFPTEGCWEITANVGERKKPSGPPLTFVVLVKVGELSGVAAMTTAASNPTTAGASPLATHVSTTSAPSVTLQTAEPTTTTEPQSEAGVKEMPGSGGADQSNSVMVIVAVLVMLGLVSAGISLLARRINRGISGSSSARQ